MKVLWTHKLREAEYNNKQHTKREVDEGHGHVICKFELQSFNTQFVVIT